MEAALTMLSQYSCRCGNQFERMVESVEQRDQISCPQCGSTLETGLEERILSFYAAGEPNALINICKG